MQSAVRAVLAVVCGVVAAFVTILLVEAVGALVRPAGVAPNLQDEAAMRTYLAALPLAAYAFQIGAYLLGSAIGGIVAVRVVGRRSSRVVWVVAGLVLAATVANLVMIPHPVWFSVASLGAIFIGAAIARQVGPADRQPQ